jgi:hypothetical protein
LCGRRGQGRLISREKGRGATYFKRIEATDMSTGRYIPLVAVEGETYSTSRGGRQREREWALTMGTDPHPRQAVPKIASRLNVSKKVAISSLCTL